jgi:hypothetical protein
MKAPIVMRYSTLVSVFLACAMSVSNGVASSLSGDGLRADSAALDNAYVRVFHNYSAYGPSHAEGVGTRVIVALTTLGIRSNRGELRLERGQIAVFRTNESYGPPTGEFFEVAFKVNHPAPKGPDQWIEPTKNAIVYEDDEFRVFEERLAGGDERPLHSHAQRVVVRLNEVQLTDPRFHETPRPGSGIQVPNTVRFAEPMVHAVKNVSKGPLLNIVIEFKVPHGKLLFDDDFTTGAAQWLAEFEDPTGSSMSVHNGVMEVKASAGATLWFRKKLSGNIMITYNVTLVDSGGPTDRVSDLNAFWMASDPARETPFNRDGKFTSYDNLDLYYAGVGGHDNTTTRFRRYRHGTDKSVLQEYTDRQHLLKGNTVYSVKILVRDGKTSYSINDIQYFEYADTSPVMEGYFAFRTTRSHQRITHFKVEPFSL